MNLRTYTSIISAVAVTPIAQAQSDAESILRAAIKAGKELKSAQYNIEATYASTKIKTSVWQVNAAVPDGGLAPGKYRVKGTSEENGDLTFFEIAYDGKTLRVKNNSDDATAIDNPTLYQAGQYTPLPAVMSSLSVVGDVFTRLLTEKPELRLLPQKTVGPWTCDVVEIKRTVTNPAMGEVVLSVKWAFDRKTHLPVQRSSDTGTVTITKLILNPAIDDKVFRLDAKEVKAVNPLGPATERLLAVGAKAPNFVLKDPAGKVHTLAKYRGKVLVLDFWGTWCIPCRKTMPILQQMHRKGVAVLGVSVDMEADPAAFMRRMGYSYPIALKGQAASKAYKAELLPTLYVIGPDGRIKYRQAGINPDDAKRLPKIVQSARGKK